MQTQRRNRRGVETVEFAVSLPLLLLLVSGMIDFGWYFYQAQSMQEAVRNAARTGCAEPLDGDPVARATSVATAGMDGMPYTADLDVTMPTDATGDLMIRVHAEAPYVGLWSLVNWPWRLDAGAAMRMEEQPPG